VPTGALVASDYDKYCCSNRDHGGGTLYILCSYVKLSIGESTTRIVILNDKRSAMVAGQPLLSLSVSGAGGSELILPTSP